MIISAVERWSMPTLKEFNWISEYKTYDWDLPLLTELGLRPFRGNVWDEIYIGHAEIDDALIFVWVTGAPAQFWRFEIVDFGNYQTHCITTGSGSLRDHWPHVLRIAQGMMGVESVYWGPPLKGKTSVKQWPADEKQANG
jgi:hypothetical protein